MKTMTRNIFLLTGAVLVLGLAACSDSSSTETVEIVEAPDTPADSTENTPSDSASDTTSTSASDWEAGVAVTYRGHISAGHYKVGTEVVVRELDSALKQTGTVYKTNILDDQGTFTIEDAKFESPMVSVEVSGSMMSVCNEWDYPKSSSFTILDLRITNALNTSSFTDMQTIRAKFLMEKGMSFKEARAQAAKELKEILLMEELQEDFESMNFADSNENNYYLLAAEVLFTPLGSLNEGDKPYSGAFTKDTIVLSSLYTMWNWAYSEATDRDCFKLSEYSKKWGYQVKLKKAKDFLDSLWKVKLNLGTCDSDNRGKYKESASSPIYGNKQFFRCDSTGWAHEEICSNVDFATFLNEAPADPTQLLKSENCKDTYYFYKNDEWHKAQQVDVGLKSACVDKNIGEVRFSGKMCYQCERSGWLELTKDECEAKRATCTKDGEVFTGESSPTTKFVCEGDTARQFTVRETALDKPCTKASPKDTIKMGYTLFVCDAGSWMFTSGDSAANALIDERDGKVYRTTGIGNQRWMAQNLDFGDSAAYPNLKGNIFSTNSDPILQLESPGTLYNWNAAMNVATDSGWRAPSDSEKVHGICPEGYHIPSMAEWDTLFVFAQKYKVSNTVGTSLRGKSHWNYDPFDKNYNNDDFNLSLDGTGVVGKDNKYSANEGIAYLWTTESDTSGFSFKYMTLKDAEMTNIKYSSPKVKAAIRCVKD